jgi:serine/threonine-protein kinase
MSRTSPRFEAHVPAGLVDELEEVCDRFEEAWKEGRAPWIEDALRDVPAQAQAALLYDLLVIELVYRHRAGEHPEPAAYNARFPGHPELVRAAFAASATPVTTEARPDSVPRRLAGMARLSTATATASPAGACGPGEESRPASSGVRFRILRFHDRGGLGDVFIAEDEELHREVALKQIREPHAHDESSRCRFVAEAEITGRLEHPGIIPIYGLGHYDDGRPFYAMRFIKGDSLKEAIRRFHEADQAPGRNSSERSLAFRQLLRRFLDVCNAVGYAHSRGVLHRDLKPGNVLLGPYGETLVVDWGLAKVVGRASDNSDPPDVDEPLVPPSGSGVGSTLPGSMIGTPAYMSPEQARGDLERLGPASDVYSLGATLYHLLSGHAAFENTDLGTIRAKIIRGEFQPPRQVNASVPPALEAVCLKAMAPRAEGRYASPRALAGEIEHWLADEPVACHRESVTERLGRWARHHRPLVTGAAGLLLATTIGLLIGLVLLRRANDQIERRQREAQRNYELARQAVDRYLTTVSEERLLEEPQMDRLRKDLLGAAREFYQKIVDERKGDPSAQTDLARSCLRLSLIHGSVGQKNDAVLWAEQARSLFDTLATGQLLAPNLRGDRAEAHRFLGMYYREVGRASEALAELKIAVDLSQELIDDFPSSASYRYQLALARGDLGFLYKSSGRFTEARSSYESARTLLEPLVEDDPKGWCRVNLAWAHHHLGLIASQTGNPSEAIAHHRQALELRRSLVAEFPTASGYRDSLAWSLTRCGGLDAEDGRMSQADSELGQAVEIRRKLVEEHPDTTLFQYGLGMLEVERARLLRHLGRIPEAEQALKQTCAIWQRWNETLPVIPDFGDDLIQSFTELGTLYASIGRKDEAGAAYERAIEFYLKMQELRAHSFHPVANLFETCALLGRFGLPIGRRAQTRAILQRVLSALGPLTGPDASSSSAVLRFAHASRAEVLGLVGRHAEALRDWDRAIELADDSTLGVFRLARAGELARSGNYLQAETEAKSLANVASIPVSRRAYGIACVEARASAGAHVDVALPARERDARAESFAASAVRWLDQARGAGFFRDHPAIDQMRAETDLDSLRSRSDFQLLVMDLMFPDNPFSQ